MAKKQKSDAGKAKVMDDSCVKIAGNVGIIQQDGQMSGMGKSSKRSDRKIDQASKVSKKGSY